MPCFTGIDKIKMLLMYHNPFLRTTLTNVFDNL